VSPAPAEEPTVSVVVPSVSGTASVLECLAALGDQDDGAGAEVIVVDRAGEATRAAIRERFPSVRLLTAAPGTPLPDLRGRGLAAARGRMIAVLGEHLRPGRTWLRTVGESARAGAAAIAGPIDGGALRGPAEWAFFLAEYGPVLPPWPAGSAPAAGTNCAYARAALERADALGGRSVWDADLARRLAEDGVSFAAAPGLLARSEKRLDLRRLLAQRHHCGRAFAAHRVQGFRAWRRLAYAAATALLPPVLVARTIRTVASKGRHRGQLARALPLLAAAAVAGALGEMKGALHGPGASAGLAE